MSAVFCWNADVRNKNYNKLLQHRHVETFVTLQTDESWEIYCGAVFDLFQPAVANNHQVFGQSIRQISKRA
jgi:hypothetical protein